jgi:hypothetical protein
MLLCSKDLSVLQTFFALTLKVGWWVGGWVGGVGGGVGGVAWRGASADRRKIREFNPPLLWLRRAHD